MTKTFAFRGRSINESEPHLVKYDMLRALEEASTSKLRPAGPRPRTYRTLAHPNQKCSRCKGCVATFNLNYKPFCDTCHEYEHEIARLRHELNKRV